MENIAELVQNRRSVRTFDGRTVAQGDLEKLTAFLEKIENPYSLTVTFTLLDAGKTHLSCPVVSGTQLFVGAKLPRAPYANEAFGYSFERFVLFAQSLGIGTVWIGGTMDRAAFERAMAVREDEMMPCVSPVGYPSARMSLREKAMRRTVQADSRLPFESLFFDGGFDRPLTKETAGALFAPLELVRRAPSAVNKQPWRVVRTQNAVHFYLKRSKGFAANPACDMQRVDMGIALCHFALAAQESGYKLRFVTEPPQIDPAPETTYIASYLFEND